MDEHCGILDSPSVEGVAESKVFHLLHVYALGGTAHKLGKIFVRAFKLEVSRAAAIIEKRRRELLCVFKFGIQLNDQIRDKTFHIFTV